MSDLAKPPTDVDVTTPILPEVEMHLVRPDDPVVGRVVETRYCTRAGRKAAGIVRHVAIDVSGTPLAGRFRVGQSFGVLPPGTDSNGKPHALRLYSIASPSFGEDGEGKVVATTVKRLITEREPVKAGDDPNDHSLHLGVASNYLCDLKIGDEIRVTGPQGKRFLLPEDPGAHDYLFMATGTGIAPFRGMLLEMLRGPNGPVKSQIHLVMGTPFRTDLLYDDLLTDLAREHDNFHYHTAISREAHAGSSRGRYAHDVLSHEMASFASFLRSDRTLIYVCGLAGMQFGLYQTLAGHNVHEGFLRIDDSLAGMDPLTWDFESTKRKLKPTKRMMLEVY